MANIQNLRPWKKGQSGNPSGKPKGAKEFAVRIREATNNGEDLIAKALEIMNNPKERASDQLSALKWLANYAFGKPLETVDLTSDGKSKFNWDNLTKAEIKVVYDAVQKLTRPA